MHFPVVVAVVEDRVVLVLAEVVNIVLLFYFFRDKLDIQEKEDRQ